MKGQTAMEYLMTYGWAILIVIVVAGVLAYYGVFSPGKLVGPTKTGFAKLDVSQWDVNSAGALKLMVENRVGEAINISKIYAPNTAAGGYNVDPDVTLAAGAKSSFITVSGALAGGSTGDSYTATVSIEYYLTSTGAGTACANCLNSTGSLGGTRS